MFIYFPNRSSLSEGSNNKTANNRIRITLSARAGSLDKPIQKVFTPLTYPLPSHFPNTPSETHTESLPSTTLTSTSTSTTSTSTVPPKQLTLSDHYYFSGQDDPLDYYDNVDEISIPSSSAIKPFNKNKTHSSSSIKSSPSTLSQSTAPAHGFAQPNRLHFSLPDYSESRYDQSTLKSYFMLSPSPSTESISYANLRAVTTEKPTSTVTVPTTTTARDFEAQRQKILSFIISENQPSSFKAPSSIPSRTVTNQDSNANNYFKAFVNTPAEESTTVSHPSTTSTNAPRNVFHGPTKTTLLLSRDQSAPNKSIRLTLSSSLDSSNRIQKLQGSVDEVRLVKTRQPEPRQSLQLKPIEPTTYSPPKPFRTSTEVLTTSTSTPATIAILLEDEVAETEPFATHSRRRPYVNDFLTHSNSIPTRFPPRVTTTTTEAPIDVSEFTTQAPTSTTTFRSVIQSFTSRGLVFKENFNRTYESPHLKPIVSPYISLETQRLTNAIRTTSPKPYESTSTTSSSPPPTYRSYFLITAPIKNKTSIPSTFLFPEASTSSILTTTTTTAAPPSPSATNAEPTENSRGRYRPFVTVSSPNSIDEEPTTYAPRLRYNTRTQTMVETLSSSTEPPVARRKIVRLKSSALSPPNKPADVSEPSRVDVTTAAPLREVSEKFLASPSRETSQFRPVDVASKLSYSSDSPSTVARVVASSFNQLPKEKKEARSAAVVQITEKPFYYIRFKNSSAGVDPMETSTKRFRATVEMPEMNVPTEKELNAYVDTEIEEVYDEEENDEHNNSYENDFDNNRGEHEVDFAFVERSTTSTTASPSTFDRIKFNTTYSTIYATSTSTYLPTTTSLTSTSSRTTEQEPTTTANPKSLIPPRTSRVNNAIKTSIVAGLPRRNSASIKCNDISANAKCNEIPSRYYNRFTETNKNSLALDNQKKQEQASPTPISQQRFDSMFI